MWKDAEDLKEFIRERINGRPATADVFAEVFTNEEITAMNLFIIMLEMKEEKMGIEFENNS